MSEIPKDLHAAGAILWGLQQLCEQRAADTNERLNAGELEKIDRILAALGYEETYGVGEEWRDRLSKCLLGYKVPG